MKKDWSPKWVSSKQPRKQRKYRYNAPLHVRRKFLAAHLSEILRKRFGRRSLVVRVGDEVKVMRGENKGFKGKVEKVDIRKGKVYIEGLMMKKVDGSEVPKPVNPSNLMIIEAKMDDKRRQMVVERSRGKNVKEDNKNESKVEKTKTDKKEKSNK